MEYSKIVAVTGLPGLFELVSTKSDGAVVRSLEDGTTKFASTRIHQFSHLESIEVYTQRDNVNLVEIFNAMDKAGGAMPDAKDNAAVKKYFETAYPELDFERVYSSDLKKMVKWFEILKNKKIELKLSEVAEEEPDEKTAAAEIAPAAAKVKKEKSEKSVKAETAEAVEAEKPKKKAPTKEKKEPETKPAKKAATKKK